jgi:putative FmdB family regulatory protein
VPTYQYACTECGHQLEAVQSFSDDPLTECPNCGGRLRKQFSAVGIVFKGSGFYRTDSRSTSSASAGTNGGTGTDKDSGKADGGKKDGASTSTEKAAPASSGSTSKASSDTGTSSNGAGGKKPVSTSS